MKARLRENLNSDILRLYRLQKLEYPALAAFSVFDSTGSFYRKKLSEDFEQLRLQDGRFLDKNLDENS